VARVPDAIAIVGDERRHTFRQVDFESARLAHHLLSRGVAAGSRLGICLPRAAELPIALLAAQRVGASVVLLDPQEPPTRLAAFIDAGRISAVVLRTAQAGLFAATRTSLIDIDAEAAVISRGPGSISDAYVRPEDEAVLSVQGWSKGKAVAFRYSHGALAERLATLAAQPGLGDGDVLVATAPVSLDFALAELLLPLLVGARLVIAGERESLDIRRLTTLLMTLRTDRGRWPARRCCGRACSPPNGMASRACACGPMASVRTRGWRSACSNSATNCGRCTRCRASRCSRRRSVTSVPTKSRSSASPTGPAAYAS